MKAIIMGLPTIESSFATHTCKSIQGFNHPEYPALRVAVEVLNATEGFLWVRAFPLASPQECNLILAPAATALHPRLRPCLRRKYCSRFGSWTSQFRSVQGKRSHFVFRAVSLLLTLFLKSSNNMEALAEGAKVVRGLVDGSVSSALHFFF